MTMSNADKAFRDRFAELAQEFHGEVREIVNRRIKAANERREFGVEIIAIYSGLRMASAQLLTSLEAAGVSMEDAIKWASTMELAVQKIAEGKDPTR